MSSDKKRRALGKGLGALIPTSAESEILPGKRSFIMCPIENIHPNKYQPRKFFDESKLAELINSVKEKGVIQPLIVRKSGDSAYELIAGERRWRASQKAGLREVPVIIKDVSDKESLEIAIIENIQRADLNPIEEAEGYQRLMEEFSYTQEDLAVQVGKDRATISNHLRILRLPDAVKKDIAAGMITTGHAKALLSLESQEDVLDLKDRIVKKGISVREAEAFARKLKSGNKEASPPREANNDTKRLEERLSSHFGTKAKIVKKGSRGRLEISFYSIDELERLLEVIGLQ